MLTYTPSIAGSTLIGRSFDLQLIDDLQLMEAWGLGRLAHAWKVYNSFFQSAGTR